MSRTRLRSDYNRNREQFQKSRRKNTRRSLVIICLLILIATVLRNQQADFSSIEYGELIQTEATANSIDPLLVCAIIKQESGFDKQAVSKAGAVGLMQLMPTTAKWMCNREGLDYDEELLFDPEFNIMLGCRYLSFLMDYWDDSLPKVIASYNAGQTNVKAWLTAGVWDGTSNQSQNIPFPETQKYLDKVLKSYKDYKKTYQ